MGKQRKSPSTGEKAAIGGFFPQFALAAEMALDAAQRGIFDGIRLIDPDAGIADDFQILTPNRLDAYQVKWEGTPSALTFASFKGELAKGLADAWKSLQSLNPQKRIVIHLITNRPFSTNDSVGDKSILKSKGCFYHFAKDVLRELFSRTISISDIEPHWTNAIAELRDEVKLTEAEFDNFTKCLSIDHKDEIQLGQSGLCEAPDWRPNTEAERLYVQLQKVVFDANTRWIDGAICLSLDDIVDAAGLKSCAQLRKKHEFPKSDIPYREISATATRLKDRIESLRGGYLCLVGSPGAGKSTLLSQTFVESRFRVVEYYAFIPGSDSAAGRRGESENFFFDLNRLLRNLGSTPGGPSRRGQDSERETFSDHLQWLGRDYSNSGLKTIILVDGLDHIDREQHPSRSFLKDLPAIAAIPDGVFFVLGTQPVLLPDLRPEVNDAINVPERRIQMDRLGLKQSIEIADNLFPDDPDSLHLADCLQAKSEGHPLSLAMLVRKARGFINAKTTLEMLENEETIGDDVISYYKRIWRSEVENSPGARELLGLVCRCRNGFQWTFATPLVGISRDDRFRLKKTLNHLFREDGTGHCYFFHNSFRLYLLDATSLGIDGKHDKEESRSYYRKLAHWAETVESVDKWDEFYYHCRAGDDQLAIASLGSTWVRRQLETFRSPATIREDLQQLSKVSLHRRDLILFARSLIEWSELSLVEYSYSDHYSEALDILLSLAESETGDKRKDYLQSIRQLVYESTELRIGGETALSAAKQLKLMGESAMASHIFELAEPIRQLHQVSTNSHNGDQSLLTTWAEVAPFFRSPQQIVDMITTAPLSREEFPHDRDVYNPEDLRDELFAHLCFGLIEIGDNTSLAPLADALKERSIVRWLRVQQKQLVNSQEKQQTAQKIIDAFLERPDEEFHPTLLLLLAELSIKYLDQRDLAHRFWSACATSQVNHHDSYDRDLPRHANEYFRRFRIRTVLGESPEVSSDIPLTHNDARRPDVFLARATAKMGILHGLQWRDGSVPHALFRNEMRAALRMFEQARNEGNKDYGSSWSLMADKRASFVELTIEAFGSGDLLSAITSVLSDSWLEAHTFWRYHERLSLLRCLFEAGVERSWCLGHVNAINQNSLDDSSGPNERATWRLDFATTYALLGETELARRYIFESIESQGSIGYRKDYQLETWCRWLSLANNGDETRQACRLRLMINASCAQGDSESWAGDVGELALAEAAKVNPQGAFCLATEFAERRVVSFSRGITAILKAILESSPELATLIAAVQRRLLLLLDEPDDDLLVNVLTALQSQATEEAQRLDQAILVDALPESRNKWQRALNKSCGNVPYTDLLQCHNAADKNEDSEERPETYIYLGSNNKLSIDEAIPRVNEPQDMSVLLSEATGDYIRLTPLIVHLCSLWPAIHIVQLAERIKKSDSTGSDLMICAERLNALQRANEAATIAEYVLLEKGTGYEDEWFRSGPLARAFSLFANHRGHERAREVVLSAIEKRLVDRAYVSGGILLFDSVFPVIGTKEEIITIANDVEEYMSHVSRYSSFPHQWEALPASDSKHAVLRFLLELTNHPAHLLNIAGKQILTEFLLSPLSEAGDVTLLTAIAGGHFRTRRGLIVCLAAVAERGLEKVRLATDWLHACCQCLDFQVRVEAERLLHALGEELPQQPSEDHTIIMRYHAEPLELPQPFHEEPVSQTGYLPDTFDANVVLRLFEHEVSAISNLSKIPAKRIVRRAYDLMRQFEKDEPWGMAAEKLFRSRMDASRIRLAFQRLRTRAAEQAIAYVLAELADSSIETKRRLVDHIRAFEFFDPRLLLLTPQERPPEIQIPSITHSRDEADQWVDEVKGTSDNNFADRVLGQRVIAELTSVRFARPSVEEVRRSNIWITREIKVDRADQVIPPGTGERTEGYTSFMTSLACLAFQHFPPHFATPHGDWLAWNAAASDRIGLTTNASGVMAWARDECEISVIRWTDGNEHAGPEEEYIADGWLVLANDAAYSLILSELPPVSRLRSVSRSRVGQSPSSRVWHSSLNESQ
ncbi:P-loop NTPase family protein [Planctomicrobium piriforme]|uniref:NACHT domain-containing protein n=1 Tax=Planctomicrobium piriforme TaxID=1576369 RepID=A0A1I3KCH4_9PLAN|nr:ATP-binding protein [Planctomicrobium piriforme]SFI70216.1 hypothetical protein SAMN05421753_111189 [Planctomicrobium piriforme]